MDLMDVLAFDSQMIFNNTNQQGGNAASVINVLSENEKRLYEEQIIQLKDENKYLRNILDEKL